jgi:hypothetical protein
MTGDEGDMPITEIVTRSLNIEKRCPLAPAWGEAGSQGGGDIMTYT